MGQYKRLSQTVGRVGLGPAVGRGSKPEPRYERGQVFVLPHCLIAPLTNGLITCYLYLFLS
jgi:hypothetical protein